MEASNLHRLPDRSRPRYVNKHGEMADWMPSDAGPEARDMIEGLMRRNSWLEGQETRRKREGEREEAAQVVADQIMEVLEHWRYNCAKRPEDTKLVADSPRWKKVKARLGEGWSVDDLKHVVDYCVTDGFLNGKHPKTKGKAYLGAETLFRDSDQVEKRLGQWKDAQDDDLDERTAAWMEQHAPEMARALEVERQLSVLVGLEPTAFEPTPSELRGDAA